MTGGPHHAQSVGAELVEVVAPDGTVERIITRREMRAIHARHRAVFIAVLGTDGRVLTHQRAADKDVWPSRWDIAFGGVVAVGESWDDSARRELAEEAGVVDVELVGIGRGSYDDADVSMISSVYLGVSDGPFDFVDGEVVATEWITIDELAAIIERLPTDQTEFCPDSLAVVAPILLAR